MTGAHKATGVYAITSIMISFGIYATSIMITAGISATNIMLAEATR